MQLGVETLSNLAAGPLLANCCNQKELVISLAAELVLQCQMGIVSLVCVRVPGLRCDKIDKREAAIPSPWDKFAELVLAFDSPKLRSRP